MQAYLWVAMGSALGGMARFWLTGIGARVFGETFPWATLLINIVGSFVIGLFVAMTVPEGRFAVEPDFRAFVTVGLCGGFTTFSAFSLQTMVLMQEGQWFAAGSYVAASVMLCLLAVWAGYAVAMQLNTL